MVKNEIKIGAILSYVVIGLNLIVGLLYTPILIRTLGQAEYGLYSLISSIITYLTLLDLGFGNAIIIYTAKYRAKGEKEKEQKLQGMFLIIYTIIGIIAGILGVLVFSNVNNIFGNTMSLQEIEMAKQLMIVLIINLVITFPFSVFGSIITAHEKFIFAKVINIIKIIATPLIMIPLLLFGYKSLALVIVITILNILTLILNMFFCFKKIKIKPKFGKIDFKLLREIFAYSFFIFLGTIIDRANWSVDQFILGAVSGTMVVAIYSVAAQINNMYLNFSTAISNVLLPKVVKMEENNASNKEFTDIFIRTGRIQYIIMALIMSGFIIFGKQFVNIWAGENYSQVYIIACILMIPVTIPLIQNIGLSILQAKNKYKYRTMMFLVIAIANILVSIPLAQLYGAIGCAIGTALSLIIGQGLILNIYYHISIHLNMISFWKEILKMTFPILAVAVFAFISNQYFASESIWFFIFKIVVYIIVYIAAIWNFSMNDYERKLIGSPIKKVLNKIRREK